jgi:hypothetical protein
LSARRSGVIDESAPQQARRHAKEVRSVTPFDMPLIDQANVGLVHERGWLTCS